MNSDEQAICDLIQTWLRATAAGDLDRVLALMSEDVVFLTPGQKPFGKEAFAAAMRASHGKVRIDAESAVQEVQVWGDHAFCWTRLSVQVVSLQGGETNCLAGHTLSVLRKEPTGCWVVARDANLLVPQPRPQSLRAAVPVIQAESVARSIAWYRDMLGFNADPFGPPGDPVFAILNRDGVELMVQKSCGETGRAHFKSGMTAYIRVADVHKIRESVLAHIPDAPPIVTREYGCREFSLTDLDGHVLVLGQCE